MWKVGLVGTGFWSEKHLKAWRRIPNVEISALCNRSKEKLIRKAEQFGIPERRLYGSLEEMLEKSDIDIVDIVTGPETHLPLVRMAAAAGKHIMCQKPFAPSIEEAEAIVSAADTAGVRLMVTENWRWLPPALIIKKVLEQGTLGQLHVVRYIHSDYFTARMSPDRQLPQPFLKEMPKLIFYEMGAHWFDTWRYLFGEPKRLYAETKRCSPYVAGEDSGVIILAHGDFYGTMDMNWSTRRDLEGPLEKDTVLAHHKEQFIIDGERASLKMYSNGRIVVVNNDGNETVFAEHIELTPEEHEESHFRLQSHFIECLESGEHFQTSGADNLKTLKLLFSTYESAETHQVVHF